MMTRLLFAPLLLVAALLPATTAAGCAGSDTKPVTGPGTATGDQRDTEIKHEPCNIESSDNTRMDANGDGRPEIIKVMSGGREVCRAADINMDGVIDVFVYFDAQGNMVRRESGFDRNTLPDQISYYQNGVLIRKERETNNDRKLDTWSYFQNGQLVKEERDSTGDGYVDQWWTFDRPDQPECATVLADSDGDGQPDPASKIDTCAPEPGAPPVAPPPSASAAPKPDDPPPGDTVTAPDPAKEADKKAPAPAPEATDAEEQP